MKKKVSHKVITTKYLRRKKPPKHCKNLNKCWEGSKMSNCTKIQVAYISVTAVSGATVIKHV